MAKDKQHLPDTEAEGKDKLYLDVDRMINEGMGAGMVVNTEGRQNIEQAVDFKDEVPPQSIKRE